MALQLYCDFFWMDRNMTTGRVSASKCFAQFTSQFSTKFQRVRILTVDLRWQYMRCTKDSPNLLTIFVWNHFDLVVYSGAIGAPRCIETQPCATARQPASPAHRSTAAHLPTKKFLRRNCFTISQPHHFHLDGEFMPKIIPLGFTVCF